MPGFMCRLSGVRTFLRKSETWHPTPETKNMNLNTQSKITNYDRPEYSCPALCWQPFFPNDLSGQDGRRCLQIGRLVTNPPWAVREIPENYGRGLSGNRLRALNAIHNFGLRRTDGTTAAERLFKRDFPDIFEWVIEQMGELPTAKPRWLLGWDCACS